MEIKGYWKRKERRYIQREYWRRNIEPYGDGWPTSFDYPTTIQTMHFVPDRIMGDVVDRYLHNPSYISSRRDSTENRRYYDRARHPRNFKRRHDEYHAKHWENRKAQGNSHAKQTSTRFINKPKENSTRLGGQSKNQVVDQSIISKLEDSPNDPKESTPSSAPASKTVKPETMSETKCMKSENVVLISKNNLSRNTSKDDVQANHSMKCAIKSLQNVAKVKLTEKIATKKPATKSSKDEKESNATVRLETKSKVAHQASPKKNIPTDSFEDNTKVDVKGKVAQAEVQDAQDDTSSYHPKSTPSSAPVSKTIKLEKMSETKCTKSGNVVSITTNNLSRNIPKDDVQDDVQANDSMKCTIKALQNVAKVKLTEKIATKKPAKKSSKDEKESNVTVRLETKSKVDHQSSLKKNIPTDLFEDNAKVDVGKVAQAEVQHAQDDTSSYHPDSGMRHLKAKCSSKDAASLRYVTLKKDGKLICRTKCTKPPIEPSLSWNVDIVKRTATKDLQDLPRFFLYPAFERHSKENAEWIKFLTFLYKYKKVATVLFDDLKICVLPPESNEAATETTNGLYFDHAVVVYELRELCGTSVNQKHVRSGFVLENEVRVSSDLLSIPPNDCIKDAPAVESNADVKENSYTEKGTCSSISKCHEAVDSTKPFSIKVDVSAEKSYVRADPSYLKTLGQAHSSWIFGAIAELVDNSKDAKASRLNIAIETILDKTLGSEIPMLSVIDDGNGMNHLEILRMISFGHKQIDEDNANHIGTFGIGFKTGSMRLGKDALVLTQTTDSRSVAFLSQSLNEGNDNLQIPVVSYRRRGQCMEIDTNVQSKKVAKYNLNAIKEFSPFDEYLIGEKAGLFRGSTGTQIYIWNLDKWGSNYTLEWQEGIPGGSSFNQGDIFVRSRRVRTRPGQTSRKVHLDYSLRSYLEVIFLEPRMKIYVQGSLVKSRPLAKSLNNTVVLNAEIMGKQVQLTLGRCRIEWDEANGGIFLYWRGRLIEAYKRVGCMVHSADMGRGVIGVIDVTGLMDDENGCVWVHNNKQGFQDCEQYACLEEWLGREADGYWDKYFDAIELRKGNSHYKPDNEWVQCDKCRKWRMLSSSFNSKNLPKEWFCYMEPFNGRCNMPEEQPGQGVITVGLKRSCHDPILASNSEQSLQIDNDSVLPAGKDQDALTLRADHDGIDDVDVERPVLKRLRRRPPRYC